MFLYLITNKENTRGYIGIDQKNYAYDTWSSRIGEHINIAYSKKQDNDGTFELIRDNMASGCNFYEINYRNDAKLKEAFDIFNQIWTVPGKSNDLMLLNFAELAYILNQGGPGKNLAHYNTAQGSSLLYTFNNKDMQKELAEILKIKKAQTIHWKAYLHGANDITRILHPEIGFLQKNLGTIAIKMINNLLKTEEFKTMLCSAIVNSGLQGKNNTLTYNKTRFHKELTKQVLEWTKNKMRLKIFQVNDNLKKSKTFSSVQVQITNNDYINLDYSFKNLFNELDNFFSKGLLTVIAKAIIDGKESYTVQSKVTPLSMQAYEKMFIIKTKQKDPLWLQQVKKLSINKKEQNKKIEKMCKNRFYSVYTDKKRVTESNLDFKRKHGNNLSIITLKQLKILVKYNIHLEDQNKQLKVWNYFMHNSNSAIY